MSAPPTSNSEMTSPSSSATSKSGGSSGQTKVGIAAAVAVNVLTTSTVAEIDNGLTVTAGGALTVGTTNQTSALALADGAGDREPGFDRRRCLAQRRQRDQHGHHRFLGHDLRRRRERHRAHGQRRR